MPTSADQRTARAAGALKIAGLTAGYGKAVVLHDLAMTLSPGELVGVAGPNGAGKSTLLRAISGVASRSASTLEFEGRALADDPVRVVAAGVVHVPEGRRLFAGLTAEENLQIGAVGSRVKNYAASRSMVLDLLPQLEPLLKRKAGVLSGGQQQLVAVARGLIGQPKLLMIDELSLGLSPTAVISIGDSTVRACRDIGASLLWVDQNLAVLRQRCDRVVLLRDGKTVDLDESAGTAGLGSAYF